MVIETVRLICSDAAKNSNKYWYGFLHDNGSITSENGRVGVTSMPNTVRGNGKHDFDKLVQSKLKKGYTLLKTVAEGVQVSSATVAKSSLHDIAMNQIKRSKSPELDKLIKMLVDFNVHEITKHTAISFNSSTGLFSTPLGIVTPDGITDARNLLVDLNQAIQGNRYGKGFETKVNQYLMLIPQNLGMKRFEPKNLFPDVAAVQKQNDILDSLESSYSALQTTPVVAGATPVSQEKVFEVAVDILQDSRERDRIEKKYRATRKDMHVCAHLKIKQIYTVSIASSVVAFTKGSSVGGIQELWHGTKKANLLSILKSNLKVSPPSTAAIAGKMFGNGVYFAIDSTKSLNYSYGYWDGKTDSNCFMFLASVALGKHYTPRSCSEHLPKAGYDSTWAKAGQSGIRNDEIIVYHNDRFRLDYLIEFGS